MEPAHQARARDRPQRTGSGDHGRRRRLPLREAGHDGERALRGLPAGRPRLRRDAPPRRAAAVSVRNEVIEGLDAAAAQLSAGERAKVRMGCDRAYGDRGFPYLVPPKTALVFDLEMLGAES